MQITEQRPFPSAKAVISHRNRQRDVDASHANLNLVAKQTSRVTITCRDEGAIAVLMIVDQLHGVLKASNPNDAQHRSKNLFFIDTHLGGGDVIEEASSQKEAFLMARHTQATTIDDQLRAS